MLIQLLNILNHIINIHVQIDNLLVKLDVRCQIDIVIHEDSHRTVNDHLLYLQPSQDVEAVANFVQRGGSVFLPEILGVREVVTSDVDEVYHEVQSAFFGNGFLLQFYPGPVVFASGTHFGLVDTVESRRMGTISVWLVCMDITIPFRGTLRVY